MTTPEPLTPLHLVVTGTCPRKSHPYGDAPLDTAEVRLIHSVLNRYAAANLVLSLTNGDAQGVDRCSTQWANSYDPDLPVHRFFADWKRYGRSAGPKRNEAMLRGVNTHRNSIAVVVLGFTRGPLQQSRGTSHTLELAGSRFAFETHHYRLDTLTQSF